jgi:flagellar assembly protein FliH
MLRRQQRIMQRLEHAYPAATQEMEKHLVELACEVAQKLVAGLPITVAMVEAAVHEALAEAENQAGVEVCLNPEDLELLKGTDSSLLRPEGRTSRVVFQASSDIGRGDCLVRTRFGTIDGRRETKYALLRKNLLS